MVAGQLKVCLAIRFSRKILDRKFSLNCTNSLSEFRGEAKLSTYIQKIAINLTLNEIKRRKRFFSMFSAEKAIMKCLSMR